MATMKAIQIHQYGGPGVLQFEEAPLPAFGTGELLIRIRAASVNPLDWKIRAGYLKDFMPVTFPHIPGWDFAGVVEAAGPGTSRFRAGDAVFGRRADPLHGTYAEYTVVNESFVVAKPPSLDPPQAAAIPVAALTAWQALDAAELVAGQTILVQGAAGGVGSFAVQLAKLRGAHVLGTASARNHSLLRQLGVDQPIDYQNTRVQDSVRAVDVVLDTVGGETQQQSFQLLRRGGRLLSIVAPPSEELAAKYSVRVQFVGGRPDVAQLQRIADLVLAGQLQPIVQTVLPLTDARAAHELSQAGHVRGKLVLEVL